MKYEVLVREVLSLCCSARKDVRNVAKLLLTATRLYLDCRGRATKRRAVILFRLALTFVNGVVRNHIFLFPLVCNLKKFYL